MYLAVYSHYRLVNRMLDFRKIRTCRQWQSSTGLSQKEFQQLAMHFGQMYEFQHGFSLVELSQRTKKDLLLNSYEDCLFFVLFQLKNGLCYDNLGLLVGTDASNAQRNFERNLALLSQTLEKLGVMPVRNFKDIAQLRKTLSKELELIVDATEHSTERPKDNEKQKDKYSGKKRDTRIKS
jgi:hypothetical protein